jgi:hypothetical protein
VKSGATAGGSPAVVALRLWARASSVWIAVLDDEAPPDKSGLVRVLIRLALTLAAALVVAAFLVGVRLWRQRRAQRNRQVVELTGQSGIPPAEDDR